MSLEEPEADIDTTRVFSIVTFLSLPFSPHTSHTPAYPVLISTTFKMADPGAATPSPQPDLTRNRLPTLFEVLSRRTLPPVDLFSFYIYMRDQQRSVDYLDFWSARLP